MYYSFVRASGNVKTGPIPVTMTQRTSCPTACPFRGNGCYAESGNVRMHWGRLDNGGIGLAELVEKISELPKGQLWRHNVAGDLTSNGVHIDTEALNSLTGANADKRGFTYTHADPRIEGNAEAIKSANDNGFTVNLSADNLTEADEFKTLGIGPVVVVLPSDFEGKNFTTPAGNRGVVCPAMTLENMNCMQCGLCANTKRNGIVGFPAHGVSKRKVDALVR